MKLHGKNRLGCSNAIRGISIFVVTVATMAAFAAFSCAVKSSTDRSIWGREGELSQADSQERASLNYCYLEAPETWNVLGPLDSAYLYLSTNKPSKAKDELRWAERELECFECLNEDSEECELLFDIQLMLVRTEVLVTQKKFMKAMQEIGKARQRFEAYCRFFDNPDPGWARNTAKLSFR